MYGVYMRLHEGMLAHLAQQQAEANEQFERWVIQELRSIMVLPDDIYIRQDASRAVKWSDDLQWPAA